MIQMKKLFYFLMIIFLGSCGSQNKQIVAPTAPEKEKEIILVESEIIVEEETNYSYDEYFDLGNLDEEKNIYYNDFFKLKIPYYSEWIVQTQEQTQQLVDNGTEILFDEDDHYMRRLVKLSEIKTAYLFTLFEHKVGAPVDYNPSFMALAENIESAPGIEKGSDYLYHSKMHLENSKLNYKIEEEFYKKKISGSDFHIMKTELHYLGKLIKQDYVTTISGDFALSFILSYANEEQQKELYGMLEKISIGK